ncbi:MAG: exodeoxyribonuclease III [Chloroflexi bacterium]|nr:exodeoxyribonuclease III [Chloroflexota bacterium]
MPVSVFAWNVNGIRAAQKKGFLDWLATAQPDILGVQETKAQPDQLDEALRQPEGYHSYWASAERKGYSGVGLYSRIEPQSIELGLGIEEYDVEGRTIIAHFEDFVFITAYFPNGKADHSRVPYKMAYKAAFEERINALREAGHSVIFCGDVNTAHNEIDLARPKQNTKTTGFLREERDWLDRIVDQGWTDTFRNLYPDREDAYSWWSLRSGARQKNVGWRIDYVFVSPDLVAKVVDATIHTDVMGSDHCPVSVTLEF